MQRSVGDLFDPVDNPLKVVHGELLVLVVPIVVRRTSSAGPVAGDGRHAEDQTLNRLVPLGNVPVRT